ncbi:MAG: oligosaccharide flippase family protein [Ignavibacteria bacterium]|jgi:O-antigen/teichoic acid export membrane protein
MQENVKYFLKHTLAYGISNIAQKASGIILVPLYTKYLSTEKYGQLGILLVTIIILSQGLTLGQGQAIIRYSNIEEYREKRKSIFFTLLSIIVVIALLIITFGKIFLVYFADLFHQRDIFYSYLNICIFIIAVTCINTFLLNKLRADEKSTQYTITGIAKLVVNITLTVYLVAFQNKGINGILYSNLASEIISLLIIVPYLRNQIIFHFEKDLVKESLKFGIPLIFSTLAMNFLNWSDRYVLKLLTNYSTLGLYELGYKTAGILNMFFIVPFNLTLMPLAYKFYKQEGDKLFYSKILTFFSFVLFWGGLALSVFGKEVIQIFALDSSYYPAYEVVPLLTLSYCIFGVSLVTMLALYLTGKTNTLAVIFAICSLLNIALNFVLIPHLGMIGAALNTLIAFVILLVLTTITSNKYYKINFEYVRLVKIVIVTFLLYFLAEFFSNYSLLVNIIIKSVIIMLYPTIILLTGFFKKDEIIQMKKMFNKIKSSYNLRS